MSDTTPLFQRRTLAWVLGIAITSFVCALFWAVFGPVVGSRTSAGADSFSRSAVGHRAFVDLLRELDIPVVISRHNSGRRAGYDAILCVLEPSTDKDELREMLRGAARALVVLPKWNWVPKDEPRGHVETVTLTAEQDAQDVLDMLRVDGNVLRRSAFRPSLGSRVAMSPTIAAPVQLIGGSRLEPLVMTPNGAILLGYSQRGSRELYVLSDPDLLSNHGLAAGENAQAVARLVEHLRDGSGTIIVDETLHGYKVEPSIFRALLRMPLLPATLAGLLTLGILLWSAMGRFGAPRPMAAPLGAGKEPLIANVARLLRHAGDPHFTLHRYLTHAIRDVGERLHMPSGLTSAEATAWLAARGNARDTSDEIETLREGVAAVRGRSEQGRALALAKRIHRWKEQMTR